MGNGRPSSCQNAAAEGTEQKHGGKNETTVNPQMWITDDGHKYAEDFSASSSNVEKVMEKTQTAVTSKQIVHSG